jgi:XTP/dITP diphosphohydrolase
LKLYCATGNKGKLREFHLAAEPGGVDIELVPGFSTVPSPVEDGATFNENALIKAHYYGRLTDGQVFADDSGLEVDALGGAPGIRSARYSGEGATDESNNQLLLANLVGVKDRRARFVCSIAVVERGEVRGIYRGKVEGEIIDAPQGSHGFGYDPLFYYAPFGCTFGEVGDERKFEVSHRGQALRAMLRDLTGKQ